MSADMIPVNVGGCDNNRFICQLADDPTDVSDSKTGINEQSLLFAAQQIAVGVFRMQILADDPCVGRELLHRVPIVGRIWCSRCLVLFIAQGFRQTPFKFFD